MPLDPASFASLVSIYQGEIDSLIANMGKDVNLYFFETITNMTPEFYDPIRESNHKMPDYKGTLAKPAPITVQNIKTIKALIKMNPSDFESFGINVENPTGVVRLKTFLTDVPDLVRCDYIVPNLDADGIIHTRYKLIREPIPVGLKYNRYAISFWTRV